MHVPATEPDYTGLLKQIVSAVSKPDWPPGWLLVIIGALVGAILTEASKWIERRRQLLSYERGLYGEMAANYTNLRFLVDYLQASRAARPKATQLIESHVKIGVYQQVLARPEVFFRLRCHRGIQDTYSVFEQLLKLTDPNGIVFTRLQSLRFAIHYVEESLVKDRIDATQFVKFCGKTEREHVQALTAGTTKPLLEIEVISEDDSSDE